MNKFQKIQALQTTISLLQEELKNLQKEENYDPDTLISDIPMSIRLLNSLIKSLHCTTVRDVYGISKSELLKCRSIGKKSIEELETILGFNF